MYLHWTSNFKSYRNANIHVHLSINKVGTPFYLWIASCGDNTALSKNALFFFFWGGGGGHRWLYPKPCWFKMCILWHFVNNLWIIHESLRSRKAAWERTIIQIRKVWFNACGTQRTRFRLCQYRERNKWHIKTRLFDTQRNYDVTF